MQWCMCGAQAGYPHERDCPYPLFVCGHAGAAKWEQDRAALAARIAAFEAEQERQARRIADGQVAALLGEEDHVER